MSRLEPLIAALEDGLDALEAGDLEGFMRIIEANSTPDVEFTSAIGAAMSASSFRGFDGLRTWFTELLETVSEPRWRERRYEPVSDDLFLFFAIFGMKGSASGVPVETEVGQVFEVENGLFKRGTSYASHAQARAAAAALVA
jgi:hypothetical protein